MFVHVPCEAVSVLPCVALPLIVGGVVFTGGRDRADGAGVPGDVGELPDGDEDDPDDEDVEDDGEPDTVGDDEDVGDEDDDGDEEGGFGVARAVLTQRQTRT